MDITTEIVFVHSGNSWYLPYALYQASAVTEDTTNIVLIGDNNPQPGIGFHSFTGMETSQIASFKKHYQHMSTNSEEFELFCWLRWFYLLEYMRERKAKSVLYVDSDVLLYSTMADMVKTYAEVMQSCGFLIPEQKFEDYRWVASGHVSYWTYDALAEFCEFCTKSFEQPEYLDLYRQKWDWHITNKMNGGICDMTTFYLFWKERSERIFNLARSHHGKVFDRNMKMLSNYKEHEYTSGYYGKAVRMIEGKPHFLEDSEQKQLIRANTLHFQGGSKKFIPGFYKGRSFAGKAYYDLRYGALLQKARIILNKW